MYGVLALLECICGTHCLSCRRAGWCPCAWFVRGTPAVCWPWQLSPIAAAARAPGEALYVWYFALARVHLLHAACLCWLTAGPGCLRAGSGWSCAPSISNAITRLLSSGAVHVFDCPDRGWFCRASRALPPAACDHWLPCWRICSYSRTGPMHALSSRNAMTGRVLAGSLHLVDCADRGWFCRASRALPPAACDHCLPCWTDCFCTRTGLVHALSSRNAMTWRLLAGSLHLVDCADRGWFCRASRALPPAACDHCLPCWTDCFCTRTTLVHALSSRNAMTWRLLAGSLHLVDCADRGWFCRASRALPPAACDHCLPCWTDCFYSRTELMHALSSRNAMTGRLLAGSLHLVDCADRGWFCRASRALPPAACDHCLPCWTDCSYTRTGLMHALSSRNAMTGRLLAGSLHLVDCADRGWFCRASRALPPAACDHCLPCWTDCSYPRTGLLHALSSRNAMTGRLLVGSLRLVDCADRGWFLQGFAGTSASCLRPLLAVLDGLFLHQNGADARAFQPQRDDRAAAGWFATPG